MLYRKFADKIKNFLRNDPNKILLVNGARQIGKSYIIRYVGQRMFNNYVEINLKDDKEGNGLFANVRSTSDFYLQLGAIAGVRLGTKKDTLVFLDEIQSYPHLLTMLKFLNQEGRYTYIASGSQLGVALSQTASIPIGSISVEEMYPLDFEEFLLAMNCSSETIEGVKRKFLKGESLNESLHNFMLQHFKYYLLVGGMPDAVNTFLKERNIVKVREIQRNIHSLYRLDASQYDQEKKLMIRKIYDMVPSYMENKKKRIVISKIDERTGHRRFEDYFDDFEYLTNSGIAIAVQAVSNPKFPLLESQSKNLVKLYLNDVGLLTNLLYDTNINAVLRDEKSINLGSVYETVIAQELHAHGYSLHYYDNKQKGEVDYLIDDYESLSVLPLEVKSGKDYKRHSALDKFIKTSDYHIHRAIVLSNEREVSTNNGICYMPIYYSMFFKKQGVNSEASIILPEIKM